MARVTVGIQELEAGLGQLRKETRRRGQLPDAELRIDARGLVMECGGVGVVVGRDARGEGNARLDGKTFGDLEQVLPPSGELRVEIGEGFVRIGALRLRAETRDLPKEPIVDEQGRFLEVVLSGYAEVSLGEAGRFSEDERFEAAQEQERLVREAARALRPLGVMEAQVREWVEEHLHKVAAGPRRRWVARR